MAEILLSHSNHLYFDRKQVRKMQPYPPLETLLAAALLRQEGFEVALFDATLDAPEDGFRAALEKHRPGLVVLCEDNFNFLTKMCLLRNRELAFFMAGAAKQAGLPVVVSSSDAADHAGEYLGRGADFVLMGEVEITLVEIARRLLGCTETSVDGIAGLAYRDPQTGRLRATAPRELLEDLDRLPLPAWDLVDISKYREAWTRAHGYFSLNLASSRGCPYRCNWCAKPIYGQSYHCHSPRRVAEEMHYLKAALAPDQIWFADDIFALSARWTEEFAAAVEDLGAQIPFKMQSRSDLMTRDTVDALRRAGCVEVWMGAESGAQAVLDAMEKGLRVRQIYQARENLRRYGIRAGYFLQFGYPGEGWAEIQETIRMVRETQPDDIGVSVSYPLPGTKFYQIVGEQLGAKQNWADSDDLAMMFQGAYTSEFYRMLRDALHLEVEVMNGRKNGSSRAQLQELWRRVEDLEKTSANPNPTVLWTCC
ncbi:MAG TPA: radical SAM protein [Bryobacterales bacterium]|nr:radical SAM protein [Bryobacterales bacterium]